MIMNTTLGSEEPRRKGGKEIASEGEENEQWEIMVFLDPDNKAYWSHGVAQPPPTQLVSQTPPPPPILVSQPPPPPPLPQSMKPVLGEDQHFMSIYSRMSDFFVEINELFKVQSAGKGELFSRW